MEVVVLDDVVSQRTAGDLGAAKHGRASNAREMLVGVGEDVEENRSLRAAQDQKILIVHCTRSEV